MIVTLGTMLRVAIVCYVLNALAALYITIKETPTELGMYIAIPIAALVFLVFTFPIGITLYGIYWLIRRSIQRSD